MNPHHHIDSFDSIEELYEAMESAEVEANLVMTDAQRRIQAGACWMRVVPIAPTSLLVVFGESLTLAAFEQAERDCWVDFEKSEHRALEAELSVSILQRVDSDQRGYLYGRAYSVACPEGEYGSTHRSVVVEVTREQFEAARSARWSPDELMDAEWFRTKAQEAINAGF